MTTHHVIFDSAGVYVPTICPRAILWQRDTTGDPWVGVYVPTPENATKFAFVMVVEDGKIVRHLTQEEQR